MNINRAFFTKGTKVDTDFIDKEHLISEEIFNMYLKTLSMFSYSGLPEEIDVFDLEYMLQMNGSCIFTKVDDKYYCFIGGLGGELNAYYHPTEDIVANPYLNLSKNFTIQDEKEGVLIKNDYFYMGLNHINYKYAKMYVESLITSLYQLFNLRLPSIASSSDSQAIKDLDDLFTGIIKGNKLKSISSQALIDDIKTQDYMKNVSNVKDVMELQQYYRSQWLIELGLNANYNMKREAINDSESAMNTDCLLPLIDMMLRCRQQALKKINKKYGTNISVELSSSWKNIREEVEQMINDEQEQPKEPEQKETTEEGDSNENN